MKSKLEVGGELKLFRSQLPFRSPSVRSLPFYNYFLMDFFLSISTTNIGDWVFKFFSLQCNEKLKEALYVPDRMGWKDLVETVYV